jgi:hypothetical protein
MKKTLLLILISLAFFSCKNEKQDKPSLNNNKLIGQDEEVIRPKEFLFELVYKTNQDDVFNIMMNNIEVDELQKKNIHIFENVITTTNKDIITAKFDAGNISNNIIVNLGNKEVKEVEIISILVSYGNNTININSPKDIDKYLAFNKFVERDSASNKIKTKKVNGEHRPVLVLKRNLINLLKKE